MCKRMAELREVPPCGRVRGACSRFRIAQLCSKRQKAAHPSPEKRLLSIHKSAKWRNAPHSRRFAAVAGYSEVAKPLECAVFRRFRRTASRVAASLAGGLTDQLQAGRVQVPSRSFSG